MATFSPKRYYFAFGSNMHAEQMSNRCPGSMYEGTAVLTGYRWQINKRGVANVVPLACAEVEGLVFSVTKNDERALDRFEGVKSGHYQKLGVWLRFQPVSTVEARQLTLDLASAQELSPRLRPQGIEVHIQALTYVSRVTEDGPIRDEYVKRMSWAIRDGLALGISRIYIRESLIPAVQGHAAESVVEFQRPQTQLVASVSKTTGEPNATLVGQGVEPVILEQSRAEHKRRYRSELAYANAYDAMRDRQHHFWAKDNSPHESTREAVVADPDELQDSTAERTTK